MNRQQLRKMRKLVKKFPEVIPPMYVYVGNSREGSKPWAHGHLTNMKQSMKNGGDEGTVLVFDAEGWTREDIIMWCSAEEIILMLDEKESEEIYENCTNRLARWRELGHDVMIKQLPKPSEIAQKAKTMLKGEEVREDDTGPPRKLISANVNESKMSEYFHGRVRPGGKCKCHS